MIAFGRPALPDRLATALAEAEATIMFGLPGGGPNLDVVGAAVDAGLRFVLAHGETAAAVMASTHALLTRTPTPVVVTRGPGAASVVNGLAQATLDRYPLVAITDTVGARSRRRVAHQRLDQRAMLAPVAKTSATVSSTTPDEDLDELIASATSWPYGGVHLDYDLSGPSDVPIAGLGSGTASPGVGPDHALDRARLLLAGAERPVVIVGMEAAVIGSPLPELLAALGCPVLTTYQAIGLVPSEGEVNGGLFTNGAIERPLLERADLLLTIGLDLVEPIPADWDYSFPVIRVSSVQQDEPYLPATVDLVGDVVGTTEALLSDVPLSEAPVTRTRAWAWEGDAGARFREATRRRLLATAAPEPSGFGPLELVRRLRADHEHVGTVTVDAGAHFLAVMPLWPVAEPLRLLISNGLATMGFAVPAAIGAALARPGEPVLALTGDGGLSMVAAELETIARLRLPVTVVVFNDSALSLIEVKQRADHGGPDAVRYAPFDFAATARAAGVDGVVVRSVDELEATLARGGGESWWHVPRLIDARIDPTPYANLIAITRG